LPASGAVLVSACLGGCACRYDGSSHPDDSVVGLVASGRAVLVCPEQDGGLPTPRAPAEILGGDGGDVLDGRARVVTHAGRDLSEAYVRGAQAALEAARRTGADTAILKTRSPSCGRGQIYDGSFSGSLSAGDGVTAALLRRHGITVLTEDEAGAASSP
jgi:uncharacterized protein YbbK (DUF523 family)